MATGEISKSQELKKTVAIEEKCVSQNLSQPFYRRELKLLNQSEITNNTLPIVPRVNEQKVS